MDKVHESDEILSEIQRVVSTAGRFPSRDEWHIMRREGQTNITVREIVKNFGSWTKALQKAQNTLLTPQSSKSENFKEQVLKKIESGCKTIEEISASVDRAPKNVLSACKALEKEGLVAISDSGVQIVDEINKCFKANKTLADINGRKIKLAFLTDTHFGSKACQITALLKTLRMCEKEKVQAIIFAGDMMTGVGVYNGQQYDNYANTAEEQEQIAAAMMKTTIPIYALGGNHDYSFYKSNGHNAVRSVASMLPNFYYLGYDAYDLNISEKTVCRIIHPKGGQAYALSYKLQKMLEAAAFEDLCKVMEQGDAPKLKMVVAGHYHTVCQIIRGNIFGLQAGCFEGKTNLVKQYSLIPTIGAWIVEFEIAQRTEQIMNFTPKFVCFNEIEDDYLSYQSVFDKGINKTIVVFSKL